MFVLFIFLSFIFFVIHIALCVWAYRDARRKGKSPEFAIIVLIALFFFPILGLIVYLLIRNDDSLRL
nr:PLDc N-terminal domain-containing protein [Cohnella lupini]